MLSTNVDNSGSTPKVVVGIILVMSSLCTHGIKSRVGT